MEDDISEVTLESNVAEFNTDVVALDSELFTSPDLEPEIRNLFIQLVHVGISFIFTDSMKGSELIFIIV